MEKKPVMNVYVCPALCNLSAYAACKRNGSELLYKDIERSVSEKKDISFPSSLSKDSCAFILNARKNGYEVNVHIFLPENVNKEVSNTFYDRELREDHGLDGAERFAKSYEEGVLNYSTACNSVDSSTLYKDKPYEYFYKNQEFEIIGKYSNGNLTEGISVDRYLNQNSFQPQFSSNSQLLNASSSSGLKL